MDRAIPLLTSIERARNKIGAAEKAGVLRVGPAYANPYGWSTLEAPFAEWVREYRSLDLPSPGEFAEWPGFLRAKRDLNRRDGCTSVDLAAVKHIIDTCGGERCLDLGYFDGQMTRPGLPPPGSSRLEKMSASVNSFLDMVRKVPGFREDMNYK